MPHSSKQVYNSSRGQVHKQGQEGCLQGLRQELKREEGTLCPKLGFWILFAAFSISIDLPRVSWQSSLILEKKACKVHDSLQPTAGCSDGCYVCQCNCCNSLKKPATVHQGWKKDYSTYCSYFCRQIPLTKVNICQQPLCPFPFCSILLAFC